MVPNPPLFGPRLGHYYLATSSDPDSFQLRAKQPTSPLRAFASTISSDPDPPLGSSQNWLPLIHQVSPGIALLEEPQSTLGRQLSPLFSATAKCNCFLHSAFSQPITIYYSCLFPISLLVYKLLGGGDHTCSVSIIILSSQFLEECLANEGE